jgi:hypothetical protein
MMQAYFIKEVLIVGRKYSIIVCIKYDKSYPQAISPDPR